MILDTTFIIDLLNKEIEAVKKAEELDKKVIPVLTTTITVFEIWQGISDIKNKEKLEKINKLLSSIGLLSLDVESAKESGRIHANLYSSGTPIEPEDSMIAGICLKNNHTLLTRNIKHFSKIKNLEIETY